MKKTLLSLVLCLSLVVGTVPMTSCNAGTILTDITKFLPVVGDILQIIGAFTGADYTALDTKITNDAQLVTNLYNTYEQNVGSPSAWNDLNAAFTTFTQDSSQIFTLAQVSNPAVQAKVAAMEAAAQTLFAIIESLEPAAPASVTNAVRSHKFTAYAPAPNYNLGNWIDGWNALVTAKTGNAALDGCTAGMQLHIHNWLLRQITFHVLK